jgi:hemoglobin/transferrin/lactoferrin receptor protein
VLNPAEDKIYINADTAKTQGLELSVNYMATTKLTPYVNITWLSREESYGDFTTKDTGTPSYYGKLGVKYEDEGSLLKTYYLDVFARMAADANVSYEDGTTEEYDSWHTFNLGFGATFGEQENYVLNVELSNIFDQRYSPANETLIAPGRAVVAKFSVNF